jgi:hypothetical protein
VRAVVSALPRQGIGPGPCVFGAVLGVLSEVAGGLVTEGVDEPVQQAPADRGHSSSVACLIDL